MGRLMIRCPKTDQAIFTGRFVAAESFHSSPVYFSAAHIAHTAICSTNGLLKMPGYAMADIANRELKFLAQSLAPCLRAISRFGAFADELIE